MIILGKGRGRGGGGGGVIKTFVGKKCFYNISLYYAKCTCISHFRGQFKFWRREGGHNNLPFFAGCHMRGVRQISLITSD